MLVIDFVHAIADKLRELWPERTVFFDEVPQGIANSFAVRVVSVLHSKNLDRRRIKTFTFDVCFFLKEHDSKDYFEWAERMFEQFETLEMGGSVYHTKDIRADVKNRIGHVLFSIVVNSTQEKEMDELMGYFSDEVVLLD